MTYDRTLGALWLTIDTPSVVETACDGCAFSVRRELRFRLLKQSVEARLGPTCGNATFSVHLRKGLALTSTG